MDNRLVLAVLLVTLSWMSMGTYAQSSGNSTATSNATTATNMTTAVDNNATSTTNATGGTNTTTATGNNATSATNETTATNMTTAANATSATNETTATNMTTAANATSAPNATEATNTTAAPTTAAPTTAAPLTPNTTVETLQTTISNTGCGTEQLCAAEPSSCNPADAGSCFFLSAQQQSGQNFDFGLSGESAGYIAASLSTDSTLGGNDTTYVCANDNGVVKFFGALLDNGQLTQTELNVNSVKGSVNGTKIQCTFAATVPSSTTTRTTNLALAISTGSFNSTSGALGNPTTQLQSAPVDLSNPNATVTNEISTNTTTSHAVTLQQSLTQALLLISASVLGLTML